MLIFDQLRKNDPQLQLLAIVVCTGLFVLLAGLWWVQIVRAAQYEQNLETQSYRSIRIPAPRGGILDRNGIVLAENRPRYNASLYLEDLSRAFERAGNAQVSKAKTERQAFIARQEKAANRKFTRQERRQMSLSAAEMVSIRQSARYAIASNVVFYIGRRLQIPLALNESNFQGHYEMRPYLPFPVLSNLDSNQVARFQEQCSGDVAGLDLEIQPTRFYPFGPTAAHVIGHLKYDDSSAEGEEAFYSYRLPDYVGVVGIEAGFDKELHGHAGAKSVLVDNLGYRQTETMDDPVEPGQDVVLTIDLQIQQAAERSFRSRLGAEARGAAVVMNVTNGDLLALVSQPGYDPNKYIPQISRQDYLYLSDPLLRPQINRATQENYAPGSIFKPIVGLACLETGLDPNATIYSPGFIYIGNRRIGDLAPPGLYDFRLAIMRSCNTYFITNGLQAGIAEVLKLGQRLHLGERSGLNTRQETAGQFPTPKRVASGWLNGDTANVCIGQGEIAVTPLQMAVMTAALANGGKVLWPRLVDRIQPRDLNSGGAPVLLPSARVRDDLGVRPRNLALLQKAMFDEVQEGGTGARALVPGLSVCGKTGTAQIMDARNRKLGDTVWFISFAPYEQPRYAVVVMVERGVSEGTGGLVCAPIAHDIYVEIQKLDNAAKSLARLD